MITRLPAIRDGLVARDVDGDVVVLDSRTNQLFHLDRSAAAVWPHCEAGSSLADTCSATGLDHVDVERACAELVRSNLIQADGWSRRTVLTGGLLGGAALVSAVALPTAAAAASTGGTTGGGTTGGGAGVRFIDISATGTALTFTNDLGQAKKKGRDDALATARSTFPLSLYGVKTSSVQVSTNGNIQFNSIDTNSGSTAFSNTALGNSTFGATAFVYWDDLYLFNSTSDNVYAQTTGATGHRIFVVQWNAHFYQASAASTQQVFQAQFFEDTPGKVAFVYQQVTGGLTGHDNGASATIGVQGTHGTPADPHSFNVSGGAVNGQSITFTHA